MITTNDDGVADLLVSLREHGQTLKEGGETTMYHHWTIGLNSRLDAIQAAVLSVKLRHLDAWSDGRSRNADYYSERFAGSRVVAPHREPWNRHIYNQYMIRTPDRDGLMKHLKSRGIGCALYYPVPLHRQQCFSSLGYREGDLPESERAARETLSIPVFSHLSDEEKDFVASTVLEYVATAVS